MLSGCQIIDTYSDLLSGTGVGDFCKDSENVKHNVVSGYLYDDGTFTTAYMNLDCSEYSVRAYTTKDGENVFILFGVDQNQKIIVETEKSFIIIKKNVRCLVGIFMMVAMLCGLCALLRQGGFGFKMTKDYVILL